MAKRPGAGNVMCTVGGMLSANNPRLRASDIAPRSSTARTVMTWGVRSVGATPSTTALRAAESGKEIRRSCSRVLAQCSSTRSTEGRIDRDQVVIDATVRVGAGPLDARYWYSLVVGSRDVESATVGAWFGWTLCTNFRLQPSATAQRVSNAAVKRIDFMSWAFRFVKRRSPPTHEHSGLRTRSWNRPGQRLAREAVNQHYRKPLLQGYRKTRSNHLRSCYL